MFTFRRLILFIALFLILPVFSACNSSNKQLVAVLETEFGKVVFEFFPDIAPKHTAHVQQLFRQNFYNGTAFHRVESGSLIQGGDPNTIYGNEKSWGLGQPNLIKIPAEFSKLKHVRGIVSAARVDSDVNSATTQFFICCKDHPEWDNQYSIFGRVISGMNVVDIISQAPIVDGTTRPKQKTVVLKSYLDSRTNYPPSSMH